LDCAREDLAPQDLAAIAARLARLDRAASWTRATLALIDAYPGVRAEDLAGRQGLDKASFKRRVRRLKDLGLTESLPLGYRLSPRGSRPSPGRRRIDVAPEPVTTAGKETADRRPAKGVGSRLRCRTALCTNPRSGGIP
jgi:hypothetical protein